MRGAPTQGRRSARPELWLVSDPARLPDPAPVLQRLPRGSGLIWRPYGLEPAAAETRGRQLRGLTRRRGSPFLVAADVRLAARLGADGVHLPEVLARRAVLAPTLLWWRQGRVRVPPRRLSIACHTARALARARLLRADQALLSPVFVTASHPTGRVLGPLRFAGLGRRVAGPLCVVALGGVRRATWRRLPPGSAAAVAGIWTGDRADTPPAGPRGAPWRA